MWKRTIQRQSVSVSEMQINRIDIFISWKLIKAGKKENGNRPMRKAAFLVRSTVEVSQIHECIIKDTVIIKGKKTKRADFSR
ncbi:hypothetical protein GCM10007422_10160 [Pedobacter zeae]|uniref:RNA-binding S4 domain-containing protein n=1 Tax=Pedobacter zeae TaxID=1737356 RepID=A0ABQ1XMY4_9SPHI|nr:hypothetical protein GCM10007422_10160 [Pedobacter zeae]